jgi:hypothetical protein
MISSPSPLEHLVEANFGMESLIRQGRCIILPRQYDRRVLENLAASEFHYSAPQMQTPPHIAYLPANLGSTIRDLYKDVILFEQIALPYFPNANIDLVADIATKETDAFFRFTHFLKSRLSSLGASPSADELVTLSEEIQYEVAGLRIEAQKLAATRMLRGVEVGFFVLGIVGIFLSHVAALQSIAGIAGSVSLMQLLRSYAEARGTEVDLKKSDFYIPYLLAKTSGE